MPSVYSSEHSRSDAADLAQAVALGRTNSGYVNVVTKSGTNQLHGSGLFFLRDASPP